MADRLREIRRQGFAIEDWEDHPHAVRIAVPLLRTGELEPNFVLGASSLPHADGEAEYRRIARALKRTAARLAKVL
ncbi:MAG: hypothetical protein ACYTGH_16675 [Planctomycetota bacterium]